jgi:hypothetical protein
MVLIGVGCAVLGVGAFFAVRAWNDRQAQIGDEGVESIKVVSSESLPGTRISPVATLPLDPKKNCVYCGVFQLAWSELTQSVGKGPLLLEGSPPAGAELNAARFTRDDASTCQVEIGAGPATADMLKECADKLRDINAARPEVLEKAAANPQNFIAYGILAKTLKFEKRFDELEPSTFHGASGDEQVKCFGHDISQRRNGEVVDELFEQVFIADYVSKNDFVLCLKPDSKDDDIVLARVPPRETLQATVDAVSQRVAAARKEDSLKSYYSGEVLQIPLITVGVMHEFKDLERNFVTPDLRARFISTALQAIRFKLDRSGAILKSIVVVATVEKDKVEVPGKPNEPRAFVFDGPFLVYLGKRGSARPYFAAWIANAELLERAE